MQLRLVQQVIEQHDTTYIEEGDEYSRLYDLASSILEECKNAAPLSDVNTAIYLFR
jgi:hypothetical protein